MALTAGTAIGAYEVVGLIGQGGMGEVYQARDTKLDRDVALKVRPQALTDVPNGEAHKGGAVSGRSVGLRWVRRASAIRRGSGERNSC